MNLKELKQELIKYSKEIGIDKLGITSADSFDELRNRLIQQQELNYQSGFEESDIEKRVRPELLFEKPQSIISIALAYPSKLKDAPKSKEGGAARNVLPSLLG